MKLTPGRWLETSRVAWHISCYLRSADQGPFFKIMMRKGPSSVLNARREKIILLQLVLTQVVVTYLWTDDATTMSCALSFPGIC